LGRLQKGCAADFAVIRGDLGQQIPEQPELVSVMRDGTSYAPNALLQAAETVAPSWRDEPWARQFAEHWAKRTAARP
jgi:hypothetical protein